MLPRFVNYTKHGVGRVGLLFPGVNKIGEVCVGKLAGNDELVSNSFNTMYNLIDSWGGGDCPTHRPFVDEVCSRFESGGLPASCMVDVGTGTDEARILAPITPPRNLMCVGKNYSDHIAEVAKVRGGEITTAPKYPVLFTKAPQCVIGTGDMVPNHKDVTKWLDYEVELAVVIGKNGARKNIQKDDWKSAVFGYTVGNDVTAREVQKRHMQWFKGKSLDGTAPLGPCIVPTSHLDASDLRVRCWVNGELRQDSSTKNLIFGLGDIISALSLGMTLMPGDVILTGTPEGVGFAMNPPQTLQPGDVMKLDIEHIGEITNTIQ